MKTRRLRMKVREKHEEKGGGGGNLLLKMPFVGRDEEKEGFSVILSND